jgi:hypothetical protein
VVTIWLLHSDDYAPLSCWRGFCCGNSVTERRAKQYDGVYASSSTHLPFPQAYCWCDGPDPPPALPAHLARPWVAVAAALDMPPVLTYATYNLLNWRHLPAAGQHSRDTADSGGSSSSSSSSAGGSGGGLVGAAVGVCRPPEAPALGHMVCLHVSMRVVNCVWGVQVLAARSHRSHSSSRPQLGCKMVPSTPQTLMQHTLPACGVAGTSSVTSLNAPVPTAELSGGPG